MYMNTLTCFNTAFALGVGLALMITVKEVAKYGPQIFSRVFRYTRFYRISLFTILQSHITLNPDISFTLSLTVDEFY